MGLLSGLGKLVGGINPLSAAIGLGGQVIGGFLSQKAQSKSIEAANKLIMNRYNQSLGDTGAQLRNLQGLNPFASRLQEQDFGVNQVNFDPAAFNAAGFNASQFQGSADPLAALFQGSNFDPSVQATLLGNLGSGQFAESVDGLMQMLRADPNGAASRSEGNLLGLAQDGAPFDASQLFAAYQGEDDRLTREAQTALSANTSSLGQAFGTTRARQQDEVRRDILNQQNLRNAQISQGSYENAQGRRLQAEQILNQNRGQQFSQGLGLAGLLSGRDQSDQQALLQAALASQQGGLQQSLANSQGQNQLNLANIANLLQNQQFNAGQFNNSSQFNASQQNSINQFNAGQQNALNQYNSGQQLNAQQQNVANLLQSLVLQSNAYAQAGNLQQNQQSLINQLLSLRANLQLPGANPQAGAFGNALAQAGQSAALFPILQQLAQRPTTGTST